MCQLSWSFEVIQIEPFTHKCLKIDQWTAVLKKISGCHTEFLRKTWYIQSQWFEPMASAITFLTMIIFIAEKSNLNVALMRI